MLYVIAFVTLIGFLNADPVLEQSRSFSQSQTPEWNPASIQPLTGRALSIVPKKQPATTVVQMPATTLNQMPVTPRQMPMKPAAAVPTERQTPATNVNQPQQQPSERQMPITPETQSTTFNQLPMTPRQEDFSQQQVANFAAARNLKVNPENVHVIGRDATVTMIDQEDGSSILLIDSGAKKLKAVSIASEPGLQYAAQYTGSGTKSTGGAFFQPAAQSSVDSSKISDISTQNIATSHDIHHIPVAVVPVAAINQPATSQLANIQTSLIHSRPAAEWTDGANQFISDGKLYVFDFLAPPVTNEAMLQLFNNAVPGETYPALTDIPETSFACENKKLPGYYADYDTNCQVFHRCDTEGKKTSYKCPEKTVFNQITLTCDWWFNVDCANSHKFEAFANSRLYTDLPLFDTPPKEYVPKWVNLYYEKLHNERKLNDAKFNSRI